MQYTLGDSVRYIDDFLIYYAIALALFAAFTLIYTWITPHREFALIRSGNVAAAISMGGAMIGFSLPLSAALEYSVNIADMVLFAVVATVVQLATFFIARALLPGLPQSIEQGNVAKAAFSAALAIAVGQLNAAALVY
jgi:putative membrane protein